MKTRDTRTKTTVPSVFPHAPTRPSADASFQPPPRKLEMQTPPSLPRKASSAVFLSLLAALFLGARPALAADPHEPGSAKPPPEALGSDELDLTELSLDQLMDIEVTVASKTPQKLASVPAAVYVLTGDEIRRAGHSSIQEALRMVPGFYVSHWTTTQWDVTARGFGTGTAFTNQAFLNQLLVMVDGVVVYTPLFAGMWWALQDIDLDDIDRIEIIRGPGGIVWGSNTVHGIVHVITKSSDETQGAKWGVRTGNDDWHAGGRAGGTFGENGHFRAWVKTSEYDTTHDPFDGWPQDWSIRSGGFRSDWSDDGRRFTFWGRGYDATLRNVAFDLTTFIPFSAVDRKKGGQLFFESADDEAGTRWHAWISTDQQDIPTLADIRIDVADLEYQGELRSGAHGVTYGAGVRVIHSDVYGEDPFWYAFDPQDQTQVNSRAFVVDTIDLDEDDLQLVLGVQAENNEFTGLEVQPSARLKWQATEDTVAWAAVSRAVRTPALEEVALSQDSFFVGNPDFRSERLISYELGLRKNLTESAIVDATVFYNDYDHLHLAEFDGGLGQFFYSNEADGHARRSGGRHRPRAVRPAQGPLRVLVPHRRVQEQERREPAGHRRLHAGARGQRARVLQPRGGLGARRRRLPRAGHGPRLRDRGVRPDRPAAGTTAPATRSSSPSACRT